VRPLRWLTRVDKAEIEQEALALLNFASPAMTTG